MSGSLFVDEALAWLPEAGSAERGPLADDISDRAIAAPPVSAGRPAPRRSRDGRR